ncbi:helix-turn-helix transcriptional regulator [Streptomyces sp. NPDC048717]|uniref:helix-turn-helix domain-containing protein n=1 Tax=Streptomyces sp. NPDC048717 TaxID=3154928 RepID=UPI003424B838
MAPGESELKRLRRLRGMTLEEAAKELNAATGGATDASLMSAWESGRRRTGRINRKALCEIHGKPANVLFAHQDGLEESALEQTGTAVVHRLITRWTDLMDAMIEVVATAREQLVVTGSRSREKSYLAAIETAVAQVPDLVHHRVLYGPPRHPEFTAHLLRLLELRDPSERRNGHPTLRIGMVEQPAAMERFFVASESLAVVPLPSLHGGADGFDSGVLLGQEAAIGLVAHAREAWGSARPLHTPDAVLALTPRDKHPMNGAT